MSRVLITALGAALALAACTGGTDPTTSTENPAAATSTAAADTTPDEQTTSPTTTRQPTTTVAQPTTTREEAHIVEIEVAGGVVEGGGLIEVSLGEELRIVVTSDVVDQAHLHGYDLTAGVGPSQAGVIEVIADIPGVFELELEESGVELARVQVSP